MKTKVIVILGPTATGKSDLAVKIAKKIGGEVISADSRQVYKGMNIGTGKITKKEMQGIPHHLLDIADPRKIFNVTDFVKLAERAICDIHDRHKVPIICGGTGFYIRALADGLVLPEVPPDKALRKKLEKMSVTRLLKLLKKLDPERLETIDQNNMRRVIRAIEIATSIGKVPPLIMNNKYEPLFIGLQCPTKTLRKRIHNRLVSRIKTGMIDEVRHLHLLGLSWKKMEEFGLEYRYISRYLRGIISRQEMLLQLETAIYQYAKRQITWFRKDKRINWFTIPVNDRSYKSIINKITPK